MSTVVKVHQTKTSLSGLLAEVEYGAEIMVARGDNPVAELTPLLEAPPRELGFVSYCRIRGVTI